MSRLLLLALIPIYTLNLSPELLGRAEMLQSLIFLLIPIVGLQSHETFLIHFVAKKKESIHSAFITISAGAVLLPLILYPLLRAFVSTQEFWLLWTCTVTNLLWILCRNGCRGVRDFKAFSLIGFYQASSLLLASYLFVSIWQMGLSGYFLAFVVSYAISIFPLRNTVRSLFSDATSPSLQIVAKLAKASLPFVPGTIVWWAIDFADRYILISYHGYHTVGIYAVAMRYFALISSILLLLYTTWQPEALSSLNKEPRDEFFNLSFSWAVALLSVITGSAFIVGDWSFRYLVAGQFGDARILLPFVIFAASACGLSYLLGIAYFRPGHAFGILRTASIALPVNIAMNMLLVPSYGALGAASGLTVTYSLLCGLRFNENRRTLGIALPLHKLALSVFLLLVEGIMIFGYDSHFVALLAYFAVCLLFRAEIFQTLRNLNVSFREWIHG